MSRPGPPPPPIRTTSAPLDPETEKQIQAQRAAEEYAFKPRRTLGQGIGANASDQFSSFPGEAAVSQFGHNALKSAFEDAEPKSNETSEGSDEADDISRRPRKWIAPFKSAAAVEATPKKPTIVQSSIPKCRSKKPSEEDFEDVMKVGEIKIAEVAPDLERAKSLRAELKRIRNVIKDNAQDWQLRQTALTALMKLITEQGITSIPLWGEEAVALQPMLSAQLQDARSQLQSLSCKTLIAMAQAMGDSFGEHMCFYLPILFKSLYVTIKIVAASADQCISAMLSRCHSWKYVQQLVNGCADEHKSARAKCTSYLATFLDNSPAHPFPDAVRASMCSKISLVISENMQDPDKDVRAAARSLFEAFEAKFPVLTQRIFEEFPVQTQKAIQQDKQQKKRKLEPSAKSQTL